jgi:hypothetical protein
MRIGLAPRTLELDPQLAARKQDQPIGRTPTAEPLHLADFAALAAHLLDQIALYVSFEHPQLIHQRVDVCKGLLQA